MGLRTQLFSKIREVLPASRGDFLKLQAENRTLRRRMGAERERNGVASGVDINWGTFDYEDNEELKGSKKWVTLDKMEADPHIKGALRGIILPMQNAEWSIQPASDDPRDVEMACLAEANILRRCDDDRFGRSYWVQTPWEAQRLPESLQMLRDGFAAFAFSTRVVGTKRVFDRIQWIEPSTVDGIEPWELDDTDQIIQLNRRLSTPTGLFKNDVPLPANQLLLHTWDLKGARYEGRPFVRSMFGAWFRKEFIQRVGAIWAQKNGAPMPFGLFPSGWDADDRARFEEAVRSARGTSPSKAYFAGPEGPNPDGAPSIKFVGAENDIERGLTSLIDSENREISHGAGQKTMMLGETETGSRAVGQVQAGIERLQVQAVAKILTSQMVHGVGNIPGPIQRLIDMNYTNVEQYPEPVCSKIDPDEQLQHLDPLIKAVQSGVIPKHEIVREMVSSWFGIVLPEDAFDDDAMAPEIGRPGTGGEQEREAGSEDEERSGNGDSDPPVEAAVLQSRDEIARRIAPLLEPVKEGRPRNGGRFPTKLEARIVQLAEVSEAFRVGERDVMIQLTALSAEMEAELMGRLRDGKLSPRNLAGQRRSRFPGERRAIADLIPVLRGIGQKGGAQVVDEIQRTKEMGNV